MAEELIQKNGEIWREIYNLKNHIHQLNQQYRNNEKAIFKICEHDWEYDNSVGPYDRIKYKCTKCSLWKNHFMYK